MRIIPTMHIVEDKNEYKEIVNRFIELGVGDYIRCCVSKTPNEKFIECVEIMRKYYFESTGRHFKLMLDIAAPKDKIRVAFCDGKTELELRAGELVYLTNNINFDSSCDGQSHSTIFIDYDLSEIKKDEVLMVGDGDLLLRVLDNKTNYVILTCMNDCIIKNTQAISGINGFLQKTKKEIQEKCLDLVAALKPECVAISYTENSNDILDMKEVIREKCNYEPEIMSKIETIAGCENIEEIIQHSDSIMLARGCLGLNTGVKTLLYYQDMVLRTCKKRGIELHIASNILRSLKTKCWPTRSEICDASYIIKSGYENIIFTDRFCVTENFEFAVKYIKELYDLYNGLN